MTDQNLPSLSPLAAARINHERMKNAFAVAQKRAAETESARADAEEEFASTLADVLCNGGKTPPKPVTLSTLQSADTLADAALMIVEKRLSQADGERNLLAFAAAGEIARAHAKRGVELSHVAYQQVVKGFAQLVEGAGMNRARLLTEDLIAWGQFPDDSRLRTVAAINLEVPEVVGVSDLCESIFADENVKMPGFIHADSGGFASLVAQLKAGI